MKNFSIFFYNYCTVDEEKVSLATEVESIKKLNCQAKLELSSKITHITQIS